MNEIARNMFLVYLMFLLVFLVVEERVRNSCTLCEKMNRQVMKMCMTTYLYSVSPNWLKIINCEP